MKVGILGEAEADESFVRTLTECLLGEHVDVVQPSLRGRGWPAVKQNLPVAIRQLHYHTEASRLLVVVDSDKPPIHSTDHDPTETANASCHFCEVRRVVETEIRRLRDNGKPPFAVAIGVADPAIEAWYQFGLDPLATEAGWRSLVGEGRYFARKRELKDAVTRRTGSVAGRAVEQARTDALRIAERIEAFEHSFPNGFGPLATVVRSWRVPP